MSHNLNSFHHLFLRHSIPFPSAFANTFASITKGAFFANDFCVFIARFAFFLCKVDVRTDTPSLSLTSPHRCHWQACAIFSVSTCLFPSSGGICNPGTQYHPRRSSLMYIIRVYNLYINREYIYYSICIYIIKNFIIYIIIRREPFCFVQIVLRLSFGEIGSF